MMPPIGIVLTCAPAVDEVTSTVTVQLPPAAKYASLRLIDDPPVIAVVVATEHVVLSFGGVAFTTPAG